MPPNKKGGKNYKKGKHVSDEPVMYERQEDQMYGRILKLLGGCNAMVFCNDGQERLCHIRGSMRKKVWLDPGDIVILSLRDMNGEDGKKVEKGDICAKFDHRLFQKLREKDKTIHPHLFVAIDKQNGSFVPEDDRIGFVFESESDEDENREDEDEDEEAYKDRATNRTKKLNTARTNKAERCTKIVDDDDFNFNIDEI